MKSVLLVFLTTFFGAQCYVEDREKARIVLKHNLIRHSLLLGEVKGQPRAKYMRNLTWSEELAAQAAAKAAECTLDKEPNTYRSTKKHKYIGQAIFDSYPCSLNPVMPWFGEKDFYNYEADRCEFEGACDNYKQMVWANSTEVGCDVNYCSGLNFYVCNYAPAKCNECYIE